MNKRSDDTCTKEAKFLSILIYKTTDGLTKVNVTFDEDTGWLSLTHMAELFQKSKSTITYHIQQVYEDGELARDATMRKFENFEFSTKPSNFYNPVVIISVGYRVKSQRGGTSIPPLSPATAGFEFRALCVPNLFTEWHRREISPNKLRGFTECKRDFIDSLRAEISPRGACPA